MNTAGLYPREAQVLRLVRNHAESYGRWPTMRDVGTVAAEEDGVAVLSVASTFRALARKGFLQKAGRSWGIRGYMVRIVKAEVVPIPVRLRRR